MPVKMGRTITKRHMADMSVGLKLTPHADGASVRDRRGDAAVNILIAQ